MKPSIDNLIAHMQELCLRIGSRHIGSPGEAQAADYIERVFRAHGFDTIRETYPVTGWSCGAYALTNMHTGEALDMKPCFFSNGGVAEGPLFWIHPHTVATLDAASVQGQICMVNLATETGKVFGRNELAERLDTLGATAAIFVSEHYQAVNTKIQRSPFLNTLLTASISGAALSHLCHRPEDTYRLSIDARKFDHSSSNIVARIGGSGPRSVIGAHYDTAPLIQGASDNASGTVALLELARLLKQRAIPGPMDLVAFSAEEYIPTVVPPGSGHYVATHRHEGIRWFMNFDSIGMKGGEDELQIGFPDQLPSPLRSSIRMRDYTGDGDDKSFHLADIPTLWYRTDHPFKRIHTSDDAYDRISPSRIAHIVAAAADLVTDLLSPPENPS